MRLLVRHVDEERLALLGRRHYGVGRGRVRRVARDEVKGRQDLLGVPGRPPRRNTVPAGGPSVQGHCAEWARCSACPDTWSHTHTHTALTEGLRSSGPQAAPQCRRSAKAQCDEHEQKLTGSNHRMAHGNKKSAPHKAKQACMLGTCHPPPSGESGERILTPGSAAERMGEGGGRGCSNANTPRHTGSGHGGHTTQAGAAMRETRDSTGGLVGLAPTIHTAERRQGPGQEPTSGPGKPSSWLYGKP